MLPLPVLMLHYFLFGTFLQGLNCPSCQYPFYSVPFSCLFYKKLYPSKAAIGICSQKIYSINPKKGKTKMYGIPASSYCTAVPFSVCFAKIVFPLWVSASCNSLFPLIFLKNASFLIAFHACMVLPLHFWQGVPPRSAEVEEVTWHPCPLSSYIFL